MSSRPHFLSALTESLPRSQPELSALRAMGVKICTFSLSRLSTISRRNRNACLEVRITAQWVMQLLGTPTSCIQIPGFESWFVCFQSSLLPGALWEAVSDGSSI